MTNNPTQSEDLPADMQKRMRDAIDGPRTARPETVSALNQVAADPAIKSVCVADGGSLVIEPRLPDPPPFGSAPTADARYASAAVLFARGAEEVLWQLFKNGATVDGDIVSKDGRDTLYKEGLVARSDGCNSLTATGLYLAVQRGFRSRKEIEARKARERDITEVRVPAGADLSAISDELKRTAPGILVRAETAQRRYLPTLAELIDRLAIVQMKAIFIPDRAAEYREEIALILADLDLEMGGKDVLLNGEFVRAVLMIMLSNRYIWENESLARAGGPDQDKRLKLTHSINGVRAAAKNVIADIAGERRDHKTDSFAAELVAEFGNWRVFGD